MQLNTYTFPTNLRNIKLIEWFLRTLSRYIHTVRNQNLSGYHSEATADVSPNTRRIHSFSIQMYFRFRFITTLQILRNHSQSFRKPHCTFVSVYSVTFIPINISFYIFLACKIKWQPQYYKCIILIIHKCTVSLSFLLIKSISLCDSYTHIS